MTARFRVSVAARPAKRPSTYSARLTGFARIGEDRPPLHVARHEARPEEHGDERAEDRRGGEREVGDDPVLLAEGQLGEDRGGADDDEREHEQVDRELLAERFAQRERGDGGDLGHGARLSSQGRGGAGLFSGRRSSGGTSGAPIAVVAAGRVHLPVAQLEPAAERVRAGEPVERPRRDEVLEPRRVAPARGAERLDGGVEPLELLLEQGELVLLLEGARGRLVLRGPPQLGEEVDRVVGRAALHVERQGEVADVRRGARRARRDLRPARRLGIVPAVEEVVERDVEGVGPPAGPLLHPLLQDPIRLVEPPLPGEDDPGGLVGVAVPGVEVGDEVHEREELLEPALPRLRGRPRTAPSRASSSSRRRAGSRGRRAAAASPRGTQVTSYARPLAIGARIRFAARPAPSASTSAAARATRIERWTATMEKREGRRVSAPPLSLPQDLPTARRSNRRTSGPGGPSSPRRAHRPGRRCER